MIEVRLIEKHLSYSVRMRMLVVPWVERSAQESVIPLVEKLV